MQKTNDLCEKGFSLIELLVAASLAAVLGLAVVATFAAGFKAYSQLKHADLARADVLLSCRKIEKDLKNTFYFSGIPFTGDKDRLSFAGFIHGGPEIGRITYSFDARKDGALIKTEQPFSDALIRGNTDGQDLTVIARHKGMSFSYFYYNADTQQYGWNDSVDVTFGIPLQVKVRAVFEEGKENFDYEKTVLIPVSG